MKNQMKKFRKRIFGVVFTLITVFSVFALLNINDVQVVKAKTKKKKESTSTAPVCKAANFELNADFDDNGSGGVRNVYHVRTNNGTFELESVGEMGSVSKNDVGYWYSTTGTDTTGWVDTWSLEGGSEVASETVSSGQPLYVTVNSSRVSNPPQNVVLTFKLTEASNCEAPTGNDTIKLQVVFSMNNVVEKFANSSRNFKANKYIGTDSSGKKGLCSILKEKVSLNEIRPDQLEGPKYEITESDLAKFDEKLVDTVYKVLFPYCWDESVSKNKKAATVRKKIKKALDEGSKYAVVSDQTYSESFDKAFNETKFKAGGKINADGTGSEAACATSLQEGQVAGHCFDLNTNASLTGTLESPITLKCKEDTTSKYRTEEGYNFENKVSYYGFKKTADIKVNYSYYKTGSSWDDSSERTKKDNGTTGYDDEKNLCSKVCEEAVEVEYGPPVVAKAGRCFEYRVRVTSRIKCNVNVNPDGAPAVTPTICSPAPVCVHVGKKGIANGSGPTEDFEACVKECDGGKYTQKCSTKCYNEVYGDSVNKLAVNYDQKVLKLKNTEIDNKNTIVTRADLGKRKMDGKDTIYEDPWNLDEAYYSVDKNGSINYNYGFALWYYFNQKKQTENQFASNLGDYGKSGFYEHEGIRRMLHNGFNCTAECKFISCGDGYYNEADAEADLEENTEEYFSKLRSCEVQATCTTKDASFSMSTEYNDKTVLYPGPTENDGNEVHSSKDSEPQQVPTLKYCQKGQEGGTCAENSVIYDYAGCYKTNKNEKTANGNDYSDKLYQTEITYPGTWINDKRQEISYKKPQSSTGWTLENQQFCLPTNAQDVNREYWLWYIQQVAKEDEYAYEDEYGQKCLNITNTTTSPSTTTENVSNFNVTPNIFASVKDFGHFGWFFNVQCFYALNGDPSKDNNDKTENASSSNNKCDTDPYNYRVRSVDLSNLFPGKNDEPTRTPGFNWTSAATLSKATTVKETGYYNVDPAKVVDAIQSRGDSIFKDDDNYLDYWFYLDNTALNLLRNYNRQRDGYTDFSGDFYTDTDTYGFTRYKSNLFNYSGGSADSGNNILGNVNGKYVKAVGNLLCNNDGAGSDCETFR